MATAEIIQAIFEVTPLYCSGAPSVFPCGQPTVKCSRCLQNSGSCAEHGWQENGKPVCVTCCGVDAGG